MKHTLVPAIPGILLMMVVFCSNSTTPALAHERPKRNAITKKVAVNLQKTIFCDLKRYKCPRGTGDRINSTFRRELGSLANCSLLNRSSSDVTPCSSAACAQEYGKMAGARRAIYGLVTCNTRIEKKRLGSSGIDKYILRSETHKSYFIRLKVMDIDNGRIVSELYRKSNPENIDTTITEMVASLGPLYGPGQDAEIPEEINEPEEPHNAIDTTENNTRHNGAASSYLPTEYSLGAYVTLISPMGKFRDTTTFASGNSIEGRMSNIPALNNVELRPLLGYYYYSSGSENVSSYKSWYAVISAGYRFEIFNWLDLTPLLGGGYIFHSVENNSTGESTSYGDPMVSLRCSFNLKLIRGLFLTAIPGYVLFFEQSNTGMYPSLDLGVLYRL